MDKKPKRDMKYQADKRDNLDKRDKVNQRDILDKKGQTDIGHQKYKRNQGDKREQTDILGKTKKVSGSGIADKTDNIEQAIKPYKKDMDYSYTLGAFPTYEMIAAKPEMVLKVLVHTGYTDEKKLREICSRNNIPLEYNDKLINKLSDKENCYVAGVFKKYSCDLRADRPHIVLVNPSNMGNLGTILRTAVGFGIYDIAIILPGADIFNPKTIRSSMGAIFRLNFHLYSSYDEYRQQYPAHVVFTFMLNGDKTLTIKECPKTELFALVFGNEATGLDESFLTAGTSILIPQSPDVDSLNLTIAVGIGAYVFMNHGA